MITERHRLTSLVTLELPTQIPQAPIVHLPEAIQTNNPNTISMPHPSDLNSHAHQQGSKDGRSSTMCSACGKPIQGPFVRALGSVIHLNCFRCMDCGDIVAFKFFPVDGPDGKQNPLCEKDYFRRLDLVCESCGQALRGSYITACNKKYHIAHFTCSLCSTLFGPQDSYYEHDDEAYCHFHYSTRFATKCAGCLCAILKQFVEINHNNRDECWHPECYMINKFWNVKVSTRRPSSGTAPDPADGDQQELQIQQQSPLPAYMEEEERETPVSLKEKQVRMEQQVYRIWTILSAFEESSAACISDMLRQVSNDAYLDALRMAEKLILHVEVLFGTIDDLEWAFAERGVKGIAHVREARICCRKIVELFTLLSDTQETGTRRMGMTQGLLHLVTSLAHYIKVLIRIALTGALRFDKEVADGSQVVVYQQQQQYETSTMANGASALAQGEAVTAFLDKLHLLALQGANPFARRVVKSANSSSSFTTVTPMPIPYNPSTTKNPSTQGVTYGFLSLAPEHAGESPFLNGGATAAGQGSSAEPSSNYAGPSSYPGGGCLPSDLCVRCGLTVEEDCVRLGTYQKWHSHCVQCARCNKIAAVEVPGQDADQTPQYQESTPNINANHPSTTLGSTSHIAPKLTACHRPPARVHEFMYDPNSLRDTWPFGKVPAVILCTEHAHATCRDGFHAVTRLEQYAFLLNVTLRRLHLLLRKQGVVPMLPVSNELSIPTSDPYHNSDRIMKSVQLDLESSSATHLPNYKGSTITESPTGQSVQPASPRAEEHEQQQVVQNHLPQSQQQQQREERQPQQVFPTTDASYAPTLESRNVPQNFETLGITENPLSRTQKELPFSGDLATNAVHNLLGHTNMIPPDVLERKELLTVPIRDSINLEEDESFEIVDEDEPESPTTSDENQAVEPPSQSSQRGPAPWILASRKLHVPQKPLDPEFMLHMAGLRRKFDGASLRSTNSTLQILGSYVSLDSTVLSDSCSVLSLPLEDEFPPTPVFRDEIPKGIITKVESSLFTAHALKSMSASLFNYSSSQHPPAPTGSVRRGYWNHRGDHLTPDGYIVFPPPHMLYPEELSMYPFENEGYQDHSGQFVEYVRRPELPQSSSKYGYPPECPYESFVTYV